SSRRRHTRSKRDWSSDVCSSDLNLIARQTDVVDRAQLRSWIQDALARHDRDVRERDEVVANVTAAEIVDAVWGRLPLAVRRKAKIGRASCRERGEIGGGGRCVSD